MKIVMVASESRPFCKTGGLADVVYSLSKELVKMGTIAGSDSVGGAGVEVDIKAMASVGVHACAVITAVTAQNTTAVERIYPMPEDMVQAQLEAVLNRHTANGYLRPVGSNVGVIIER